MGNTRKVIYMNELELNVLNEETETELSDNKGSDE